MKKHIIFLFSLMLAGVVGCSKDPNVEVYESTDYQSLIVTLPTTTTRINITDNESSVSLNWAEGDKFSVYATNGDYVADFLYSSLNSSDGATHFVADEASTALVDKADYIAIFPASAATSSLDEHRAAIKTSIATQAQDGNNSKAHFNDHLLMEAEFTYSASSSTAITFKHEMAAVRLTFETTAGYTPTKVIFDDGDFMSYTLNFSNTTAAEQYTANYVILPNEAGTTRELKATIYTSDSDKSVIISDFSINSEAVYSAGVQYRSELSIEEVTTEIYSEISTLAELIAFSDAVNGGATDLNAILLKDIDLEGDEANQWTPIGSSSNKYSGTFDGGGKTISGLYINSDTFEGAALFGVCDGATISNLTVEGEVTNSANETTAAIVGYAYSSTISNCSTTAETKINGEGNNTGGIAGYISASKLDNCVNKASIIGSRYIGGLVGYTNDSRSSYISNSINHGAVSDDNATSEKNSYVGGLVGRFQGPYGSITNSSNNGSVTSHYEYTGGISGDSQCTDIDSCYNTGEVSGAKYCGGISGYFYSTSTYGNAIINCYNSGKVYTGVTEDRFFIGGITGITYASRVVNCYNIGSVGNSYSWTTGGIIGWNYTSSTATACYNAAEISSGYNPAALVSSNSSSCSVTYCYNDSDICSASLIFKNENTSANPVYNFGTDYMKSEEFVDTMNRAAYLYNITSPNIKAYGWVINGDGYPVLDSTVTPTSEPIKISSAEELAKIGTDSAYSLYDSYILTQSIDLGNTPWTPIGFGDNAFYGTFDGGNFSVTGLSIDGSVSDQGLFGYCYNATIKNIKVGGAISNSASHAALIVGDAEYSTIENCETLEGSTVTGTGGNSHAGIIGYAYNCSISSCTNRADIDGQSLSAGIVGYANDNSSYTPIDGCKNYGDIKGTSYAAGIIGSINSSAMVKISNCYNEGKITCSGDFAGGIAAKMYGTSTDLSTMTNCANIGDVSGSTEYIGGLAGANQGGNIYNSYSLGNVSSGTRVGGLVGIHECNGSSKAHMENCYTSATVTGSGEVGLVVGKCDGATITSCYYNGSQSGVVIGLDNDSQSGEATAYESLSALLTALNSGTSGITDAATWVAGSESYPTFSFVE